MMTTTIGASVLDEQQEQQNPWRVAAAAPATAVASSSSSGSNHIHASHPNSQHDPPLECCWFSSEPLRPAVPSLLSAVVATSPQRLLLLQPSSSSSSSTTVAPPRRDHSLAMDWAISLASAEPCRCCHHHRVGEHRPSSNNSSSSHGSWRSHHYISGCVDHHDDAATAAEEAVDCDNCIAVTMIVPAPPVNGVHPQRQQQQQPLHVYNSNDHYWFPLLCRPYEKGDDAHFHTTTLNLNDQRRQADYHRRQQQALHRVQVRHVTTLQDVWEYLLQLPGLPVEQQPVGGILLCGLDALVEPLQQLHPHDPALATIRLTQTVAILMDTAACLQRTFGRPPATAVTMQCPWSASSMESHGSTNSVEAWFRAASNFWSPLVLRVVRDNDNDDHRGNGMTNGWVRPLSRYNNNNSDPDEVAMSHWIVQGGTVTARYAVLQNLDHEQHIVWRTDNRDDSNNK